MTGSVGVRALAEGDVAPVAALHRQVLHMEFLSRFGPAFMRAYYRAWNEAPGAIALVAVDGEGELVGALLGATDPAVHVRGMVRRHGLRLGFHLVGFAAGHPPLAKDLLVTRGRRYARGMGRLVAGRLRPPPPLLAGSAPPPAPTVGEITHVLVHPDRQGSGIGRALVEGAVVAGRRAGLDELVLVTPPDLAARDFYERLGWLPDGEMTSRSGEPFLRYRFPLNPGPAGGIARPPPVTR